MGWGNIGEGVVKIKNKLTGGGGDPVAKACSEYIRDLLNIKRGGKRDR